MTHRNGNRLKVRKLLRSALAKVNGLWVHRGSVRAGAEWERVIEDVRNQRIASVLKA